MNGKQMGKRKKVKEKGKRKRKEERKERRAEMTNYLCVQQWEGLLFCGKRCFNNKKKVLEAAANKVGYHGRQMV